MRRSRFTPRRAAVCAIRALTVLSLWSCGDASTAGRAAVARIEVSPASLALVTDDSRSLTARALDAAGASLSRRIFWSSSDPTVVSVSQSGVVTALAPGQGQVAVSSGGRSATVPVFVTERAVALVRLSPSTSTIKVGRTTTLAPELRDATGGLLVDRSITWSSASVGIATVSAAGMVTGVAAGTATITATAGGTSGTALVVVEPMPVATVVVAPATVSLVVGGARTLSAAMRDSAGVLLTGRAVSWASSAPAVANVSSAGAVLAIAPGAATITATSEGRSATSRITVTAVPVASVTVSPTTQSLSVGQTATLIARAADASGAVLNGRAVAWTTDRATVATVHATTGVVTAVATGQARITATVEGKTGAAVITVATIPVASIQVTPANVALLEGDSQRLTVKLLDAKGNVLTGRPVSWIGGAPAVATVDSVGLVAAIASGSAVIVASSEGARASVPVIVSPIAVATVAVTPVSRSVESGKALQLTAKITDTRGRVVAGKVATWTTSHPTRASVSSTGRVVAIAPGAVTISATSDGVVGAASITVTPVRPASVTIAPATAALYSGRSLTLVLQLATSTGAPLSPLGRIITWSTSAPTVATVDAFGEVTAVGPGTAVVAATTDGVTGSATIGVTDVPVQSVSVSPLVVPLTTGSAIQLTATPLDATGAAISGRTASWRTDAPSVASVDLTGRVTALAPGSARLTATIDGHEGFATVSVTSTPVSSVVIAPASPTVAVAASRQLSATLYGPAPNVPLSATGRTTTWTVLDSGVATISATGLLRGVRAGTTTVTVRAHSPGQLTPATMTVSLTVVP